MSLAPPRLARAGVIANHRLAAGLHWIDLALSGDWGPPAPGQYVSLTLGPPLREEEPGACGGGVARRPFSVARFEPAGSHARLGLLYAPIGRVTRALALLTPGEEIELLGPLGTAFPEPRGTAAAGAREAPETIPCAAAPFHLVGGGRGIAPLLFTADRLRAAGAEHALYYGTRTAAEALPDEWLRAGTLHRATDDGSLGLEGSVIDLLEHLSPAAGTILACGPHRMLASLAAWALRRELGCFVSIEENFGCGLGTCGGCAVPAADPPGGYVWACRDGAVLSAERLDWARWGGAPAAAAAAPAHAPGPRAGDPGCGAVEV